MPKLAKNLTSDVVERQNVGTNADGTPPAQKDFWDGKVSGLGRILQRYDEEHGQD